MPEVVQTSRAFGTFRLLPFGFLDGEVLLDSAGYLFACVCELPIQAEIASFNFLPYEFGCPANKLGFRRCRWF